LNYITLILFVLIFCATSIQAQEKDFESWDGIEFRYDINKDLRFSLNEEFRFNKNVTNLKKVLTEAGISYDLNKHFTVKLKYRFEKFNDIEKSYITRHRYCFDLVWDQDLSKRLNLSLRGRFQERYTEVKSSEYGMLPKRYFRQKIHFEYNIKKNPISPFVSAEAFLHLSNVSKQYDQFRFCIGAKYNINKIFRLEGFYGYQPEFNVTNPMSIYICCLNLLVNLN